MTYTTYDQLKDLTALEMSVARILEFQPNTSTTAGAFESWAYYVGADNNALLHDLFSFQAFKGATYDVLSTSFFDPFVLIVYDNLGNAIAVDDGLGGYGADHTNFVAPYTGTYYVSASWYQGSASSNKGVGLGVWQDKDTIPARKSNIISGTQLADRLIATTDNDVIDGGAGRDTVVFSGSSSEFTVLRTAIGVTVIDKTDPTALDTLGNIERVEFKDRTISFETAGSSAEAYRLYKAAFNRAPDEAGLGYWIKSMESGLSLTSAASSFMQSQEFSNLYGAKPSNSTIVNALYKNVLHRAPDQGGYDYWMNALDHGLGGADLLVSFSESSENQAQVIGTLNNGYAFVL